jgi:hypothetical protein
MINRRKLLKLIGAGSIGATLGSLMKVQASANNVKELAIKPQPLYGVTAERYRDFLYFWTGWKPNYDSNRLVGQWLAYKPSHTREGGYDDKMVRIFSSIPGYSGQYHSGDHFNIAVQPHQVFISHETLDSIKEFEKQKAYDILIMEIDHFYNPVTGFFKYTTREKYDRRSFLIETEVSVQQKIARSLTDGSARYLFPKELGY